MRISILVWLLHCHIDFHAEVGMAIILKIGEYQQMAAVPRNFPTCHDYHATNWDDKSESSSHRLNKDFTILLVVLLNFILIRS